MKTRHLVAGMISLALAAAASVSFADNMRHHSSMQPTATIVYHGQPSPRTVASIQVVNSKALGSQPALRMTHRDATKHYNSRFERAWGKNWQKKYRGKVVVVKPGDTLTKIAARNRTTVERLMRLNRMNAYESNHIEIGQLIRTA